MRGFVLLRAKVPCSSKLAEKARSENIPHVAKFTRPMIHSHNLDLSFSGLKTAVLYYIRDHGLLSEKDKADIAREFEDTVIDVLLYKTEEALGESGAKTLIIAGGVIANKKIRENFSVFYKFHRQRRAVQNHAFVFDFDCVTRNSNQAFDIIFARIQRIFKNNNVSTLRITSF